MRFPAVISILTCLLLVPGLVFGETYTVAKTGPSDFKKIHMALQKVVDGDILLIGPGTWQEEPFVLDVDLIMEGMGEAETVVLDGESSRRLFHVTQGAKVEIRGMTITRGYDHSGAGIYVDQGASASLFGCHLVGNEAWHTGGAGFVRDPGSRLVFEDCLLQKNYAPLNAGAVGVSLSSYAGFFGCRFEDNRSDDMAGAIANFAGSMMEIRDNVFQDNSGGQGGAIRIWDSPAVIIGNTLFGNVSGFGTIYVSGSSEVELSRNIIAGEASTYGIYVSGTLDGGCNVYFDNKLGDLFGKAPGPTDHLDDPLFCDPDAGDLNLCDDSPAWTGYDECGQVGALPAGCDPCALVPVEETTWGAAKALYR